ncbi:hypothetical protein SLEP1_g9241 [Rubroshorea leprosula]|uniref:Uncharacterized protein n=1 Tax=Rubroshorea leprosula TaxID=152421 RepID=A0AAV5IC87_9ROSI|nr:hypothetical protein SLEP1_g9241 [Rubroshorea leprosula]
MLEPACAPSSDDPSGSGGLWVPFRNPARLGSMEPRTPGFERSSSWVRTFLEPRRWVSNPAPGFESKPLGFFVLFLCWLAVMLEWDLEFGVVSDCLSCLNET